MEITIFTLFSKKTLFSTNVFKAVDSGDQYTFFIIIRTSINFGEPRCSYFLKIFSLKVF